MKIKKITVAQDIGSADECLYIDGKAWESRGESTVYACDIAAEAKDCAIVFALVRVNAPERWPDTLAQLAIEPQSPTP